MNTARIYQSTSMHDMQYVTDMVAYFCHEKAIIIIRAVGEGVSESFGQRVQKQ